MISNLFNVTLNYGTVCLLIYKVETWMANLPLEIYIVLPRITTPMLVSKNFSMN